MSRRRVLAGFAVLAVLVSAVLLVVLLRGDDAVDEDEYVAENLRLLAELPVFPGARELETITDEYASRDTPDAPVAGYYTSRNFILPEETNPARIVRFFTTQMRDWRPEGTSEASRALNFRRGEEFVHLLVYTPREYVLSVDHRCRGCPGP